MPNFMESAKSTLMISNLVRVVGALTDVERDCLAARLGMSLEDQLYVAYAAELSRVFCEAQEELEIMRTMKFFSPIASLEKIRRFTEISNVVLALNCVLEDPSTPYDEEFKEKYRIPDVHDFFIDCSPSACNQEDMWWRYEQSCVHKVIAVALDIMSQE